MLINFYLFSYIFSGSGEHFVAEVKFPFVARSQDELNISKNTVIRLAPKHRQPNIQGWLLASDGEHQGLVPANYIKVYIIFFKTYIS